MTGHPFPKARRLLRKPDFDRVFRDGGSASDGLTRLIVCQNPDGPRLGCVVGKKSGNAVRRNRIRRLYREAFRLLTPTLGAYDIVALPGKGARPTLEALLTSWPQLVAQAARRKPRRKRSRR